MRMSSYLKGCGAPNEKGCIPWKGAVNTCAGTPMVNKVPVRRWLATLKFKRDLRDGEIAVPTCGDKMCVSIEHVAIVDKAGHMRRKLLTVITTDQSTDKLYKEFKAAGR
jgi:hypothetical protein